MNDQANHSNHRQALVVGAGPVGMTAALALRHYGIEVAILEAEPKERTRPGSRAIFFHNATLKHLEEICPGLGFSFAEKGIIWRTKRTLYRGKEVYVRHYPAPPPGELPHFTSVHQSVIEGVLYDACVASGVEFFWSQPVASLRTSEEGVELTTEDGNVWTAAYVIGADGARSVVRREIGAQLVGPRSHDTFIVVDVQEDNENPLPVERVFHYQHPAMDGRNVLYVPFKDGWRVDLQLLEDDDESTFGSLEGVKGWLVRVMDAKYAKRITWVSTYQFHQAVASTFTDAHRRVLLAGEAAHLFAPFGARGFNSGVPDSVLAARAIAAAFAAESREAAERAILDAAEERHFAAEYNRDCAAIALEHIQGNSPYMNTKRELAASLASVVPSLGKWLDEGPYGPKVNHARMRTKY
ncbi:FAD-dependent monooxygenase [Alicyclobacillus cycloheptanicus]|uniref:3-(3-hydroxy-phenyl)propionate hydroxylase n=1 Tax=Alicyclobacillus cycloheptanicus TaxID=1457 RepID=A0ABT9XKJ1_9BACL|nr:FAD-dependent monooxygenase [Alicyclobacillus cycloheptanicus]MDQ0190261.1 3-(3-hydroxy-phenyl)propionate hydroxylase [Alicyclobacillus cycloheptanicus]